MHTGNRIAEPSGPFPGSRAGHRSGTCAGQERPQVGGVVVDMVCRGRFGGDMDGRHPKGVRHGKVTDVVFEHHRGGRDDPVGGDDRGEGGRDGLGFESGFGDAVDRVEDAGEAAGLEHTRGVGGAAIGVDDPPPGQRENRRAQFGVGVERVKRDVMDRGQVGGRIQPVFGHQSRQGGAVFGPVIAAQAVGLGAVKAERFHYVGGHPRFDLVEETDLGRVERVVEIEDPDAAAGKAVRHDPSGGRIGDAVQAGLVILSRPGVWHTIVCKEMCMSVVKNSHKDAYDLILDAIDVGIYRPGDRLVESELAERFGVSRTPIREALQRLETQSLLARDGRSLIIASLDHNQLAELYVVRAELEGLAARLAAQHATVEEIRVLQDMVAADRQLIREPRALARANRRFHKQIHLASHNRFLVQQLDLVHRSMALLATSSLSVEGRGEAALAEHAAIVGAIEARDGAAAEAALKTHISHAFETRLKSNPADLDAAE